MVQQLGLCYLKPIVASWRYRRGGRSILKNVKGGSGPIVGGGGSGGGKKPATAVPPRVKPHPVASVSSSLPSCSSSGSGSHSGDPQQPQMAVEDRLRQVPVPREVSSGASSSSSCYSGMSSSSSDSGGDVPPQIDAIVDRLLVALSDMDTVVRWAAARGLGAITERLPRGFGDQIVGSVLTLFTPHKVRFPCVRGPSYEKGRGG